MKFKDYFQKYGLLFILAFVMIFFSISNPNFLKVDNLLNVLRQVSMLGIVAVGMTLIMLTGGIDLSVGSMLSLINVVTAILMVKSGVNPLLAIAAAIAIGIMIGICNGLIVTRLDIPPLIATLAMLTVIKGISFILTGGLPVYGFPESFNIIGQGYLLGIPIPVIVMAIIFAAGWIVLNNTYFGKFLYAIGGNEEASRLSGINVRSVKMIVYSISGLLSSIAGIILLSRISSGQPNTGSGFEMDVITSVVLGGVSISGGQGNLFGVMMGVLIMGILNNGMIIMGVSEYFQWVVQGLVLMGAVAIDRMSKKEKK